MDLQYVRRINILSNTLCSCYPFQQPERLKQFKWINLFCQEPLPPLNCNLCMALMRRSKMLLFDDWLASPPAGSKLYHVQWSFRCLSKAEIPKKVSLHKGHARGPSFNVRTFFWIKFLIPVLSIFLLYSAVHSQSYVPDDAQWTCMPSSLTHIVRVCWRPQPSERVLPYHFHDVNSPR